jgi:hypothetical protein
MLRTKGRRSTRKFSARRDLSGNCGLWSLSAGEQLYEVEMVPTSLKIKIFKGSERGEHIAQAQRGCASKHDIINTAPLREKLQRLK